MELIDEEGNLFGVVNVIDALVVLVLVAVLVAGVALVTGDKGTAASSDPDRYVTLDLGSHPTYIATAIAPGDEITASESGSMVLTDVFVTPDGSDAQIVARAQVYGTYADGTLQYDEAPLRLNRSLAVTTGSYDVSGTIVDVGNRSDLAMTTRSVRIETDLSPTAAESLAAGDPIRVAGNDLGRIEDVTVVSASVDAEGNVRDPDVLVTAMVDAHDRVSGPTFGGRPLRTGESITLRTDSHIVRGTIVGVSAA